MRNHSYENVFHLHVHFHANQSHFHLNGFARRLVLKLRQKATRKWPIVFYLVRSFPDLVTGYMCSFRVVSVFVGSFTSDLTSTFYFKS